MGRQGRGGLESNDGGQGLAQRLGNDGGIAVQPEGRVLLVDEHFYSRGHWNATAAGASGADPFDRRQPGHDRSSDAAPAGARGAKQRKMGRRGKAGPERAGGAALDKITGQPGELLDHRFQCGAFHLTKLDGQDLQEMAIGVDGSGPPSIGRAHQSAGHVEPNGALAGPGPGGGVDRHHPGCVQDATRQGCQVPETPGGQGTILPQGGQWICWRCYRCHPCPFPSSRSTSESALARTVATSSPRAARPKGFVRMGQVASSGGHLTRSAGGAPLMRMTRPSSRGQRRTIARKNVSPAICGRRRSSRTRSKLVSSSIWYAECGSATDTTL